MAHTPRTWREGAGPPHGPQGLSERGSSPGLDLVAVPLYAAKMAQG